MQFDHHRHGFRVEDAVIHVLPDKTGSAVMIMFFKFSNAFQTIQLDFLCQKLNIVSTVVDCWHF